MSRIHFREPRFGHGDTETPRKDSFCVSVALWLAWALLLISLASCGHETQKAEKTAIPVRVAAVENFTPRTGERYSASVEPARHVNLAFRVNGFVQYLHQIGAADGHMRSLEPGDMVTA